MTRDDIRRILLLGDPKAVVVSVSDVTEAPGNVRTVTIRKVSRVEIEFESARQYLEGSWEGGIKLVGHYETLDATIDDLIDFLGPLSSWTNHTHQKFQPLRLDEPDADSNAAWFERAVREGLFETPRGTSYEFSDPYWRQIRDFGHFRPELLLAADE